MTSGDVYVDTRWQTEKKIKRPVVFTGAATSRGNTPLHDAAGEGKKKVAQLLLAANAPRNLKNNLGWGPRWEDGLLWPGMPWSQRLNFDELGKSDFRWHL